MSQKATAPGLSNRARNLIDILFNSGSSESKALAELLNDTAEGDGVDQEQARDGHLIAVCQEVRAAAQWFVRELGKKEKPR